MILLDVVASVTWAVGPCGRQRMPTACEWVRTRGRGAAPPRCVTSPIWHC